MWYHLGVSNSPCVGLVPHLPHWHSPKICIWSCALSERGCSNCINSLYSVPFPREAFRRRSQADASRSIGLTALALMRRCHLALLHRRLWRSVGTTILRWCYGACRIALPDVQPRSLERTMASTKGTEKLLDVGCLLVVQGTPSVLVGC